MPGIIMICCSPSSLPFLPIRHKLYLRKSAGHISLCPALLCLFFYFLQTLIQYYGLARFQFTVRRTLPYTISPSYA